MTKTWTLLVAGLGATALTACAQETNSKPILVAQVSPHFIVTRGGLALPTGQMIVDTDTDGEISGTFDNGDSTLEFRARVERAKSLVGTAELTFDGARTVSLTIDYATGETKLSAKSVKLSANDVANLARLQIALHGGDSTREFELGTPKKLLDGLVSFVGMAPVGSLLGSFERTYPTLALFDIKAGRMNGVVTAEAPVAPNGAELSTMPSMPAGSSNPFQRVLLQPYQEPEGGGGEVGGGGGGYTPPAQTWMLRPAYTGPFIGTGGTGIKCVSEGYYYAIGYDWRKRWFSTRHIVNTWAPVMPRGYTADQAFARDGYTCHGLAGPNCGWAMYRWSMDPLRHDDCVRKQDASNMVSVKCGDEFADSFDDAAMGTDRGCLGGASNTWTTNRIPFTSWAPHYEGSPYCGNGVADPGEDHNNCENDVPEPPTSGTCGNGVCDATETSDGCPSDCLPANCSNAVCDPGESAASCPEDCAAAPRIGYWYGKVNVRSTPAGDWQFDEDCTSGANIDPLTYCRKFWPNTVSVTAVGVSYKSANVWATAGCTEAYPGGGLQEWTCNQ